MQCNGATNLPGHCGIDVSSGPVVRGVNVLPSAVDVIFTSCGGRQLAMHAVSCVSGRGIASK